MSWIKVKTTLSTEPAVAAIAARVKRPDNHVVGCLVAVWSWADSLTADGFVQHANLSLIDRIAGMKGFGSAMCSVDWLHVTDGGIIFPRWERHNGQSAKARAGEADRKRMQRAQAKCPDSRPDVHGTAVSTREEERREEVVEEGEERGRAHAQAGQDLALEPTPIAPNAPTWAEPTGWRGVTDDDRTRWKLAYPACDIDRQLAQMDAWLRANPAQARKSNWLRFISNWLKREQDRGGDVRVDRRSTSAPHRPSSPHITAAPTAADHAKGFFHGV